MTNTEARAYASQWGSYIHAGDPGACMYGFPANRLAVQSEPHRAACIAWMVNSRAHVVAEPRHYDADELTKIDALVDALRTAPLFH